MTSNTVVIATMILVPTVGLAIWAWLAIAEVDQELRSFSGFDGMHLDIGSRATDAAEGAR